MTARSKITTTGKKPIALLKVLNPFHVWGLGVGIVLVGEFMGWNFAVGKGGATPLKLAAADGQFVIEEGSLLEALRRGLGIDMAEAAELEAEVLLLPLPRDPT